MFNGTENLNYLLNAKKVAKKAYFHAAAKCKKIYSVSIILVPFIYPTITLHILHLVHDLSPTNLKLPFQRYDKRSEWISLSSFNILRTITKYVKGFEVTGFLTTHSIKSHIQQHVKNTTVRSFTKLMVYHPK
jgi:hypothetical protein